MYFHANYVSTSPSGNGDYYQAMFEAEQDAADLDSLYLLIQRQFEDPSMPIGAALGRLMRIAWVGVAIRLSG
jgi:hypothetical protein